MSPLFEWYLAAQWWGYQKIEDFFSLPGDEQSRMVAVFRLKGQMESVTSYTAMQERDKK